MGNCNDFSLAVMLSIQHKWCELIVEGGKTIEIRKTRPKIQTPFKCYIYECKGRLQRLSDIMYDYEGSGKVIGEFTCDRIDDFQVFENNAVQDWHFHRLENSKLSYEDLADYIGANNTGYAWHISNLHIYDEPKELSMFMRHDSTYDNAFGHVFEDRSKSVPITRPPQSWCYVETGLNNEE